VVIRRNNLFVCYRFEEKIESRAASRNASLGLTPDAVVDDFAALLKSYHVSRVTGDPYAGEFPRELFRRHGIAYDLAKRPRVNCSAISCRF
jgi:hypothetical protein